MILTLHLTENCNMNCSYCTREKRPSDMTENVLDHACEMIFSSGKKAGVSFFGGEPLLRKDLINRALDRCAELSAQTGMPFECRMTTNGTLLDEAFLQRARAVSMGIGLSFDGLAQDCCRRLSGGGDSFSLVEEKAKLLLSYLPDSYAMLTLAPEAADRLSASVRYLYELGFRKMTMTIAYGSHVTWTEEALQTVENELRRVADFFENGCEAPFYFSPFHSKITDVIRGKSPKERCHLGLRQMPVAVDGRIYACTQFIGDEDYCMGDVFRGLDLQKQKAIALKMAEQKEPTECLHCDFRNRCTHMCGCTNRLETGDETQVSATNCLYEQMVIRLADELAERIYQKDERRFMEMFC